MQMITFLAAAAFYASAEAAKLTNTPQDFVNVKAGQPFTISWTDAAGPVTILLKNGPSTNLNTVSTIASGQTGTSFSWTPSASLPEDQYAIEITDSSAPNYSVQFPITGGTAAPSSTGPSHTSAPSYGSSESASHPASTIASTGYSSASRNATSSGYYTATSASIRPTTPANATSIVSSSSTLLTSTHSTAKPSSTNLPDTSVAVSQASPFALLLLSLASAMFFL
ncbi:hypothetical protein K3495_g6742 [Podosphaera aphanis]|nr:hypothetical protein K3495_g6742 [Podosphaera aphanis]